MTGRPPSVILVAGMEVGDWLLLEREAPPAVKRSRWRCECACGVVRSVEADHLTRSRSRSCGAHPIGSVKRQRLTTPAVTSVFRIGTQP